jgi:ribosome maturation factor RimP
MGTVLRVNVEDLKTRLEQLIEDSGFELAELTAPVVGGRQIVRIYIYSPDGVTLDDCARISRQVSDRLDTDDPVAGRYTLEVSSLGLDRPLTTLRDFRRRVGEKMAVTYNDGNGKKTIQGLLKECDGPSIRIETGETIVDIPVGAKLRGKILF